METLTPDERQEVIGWIVKVHKQRSIQRNHGQTPKQVFMSYGTWQRMARVFWPGEEPPRNIGKDAQLYGIQVCLSNDYALGECEIVARDPIAERFAL